MTRLDDFFCDDLSRLLDFKQLEFFKKKHRLFFYE